MRISLSSYFDPWSKEHHGLKNFKVISRYQKVAAVVFTALAGAVSFGIFALPVFRLLTKSNVPTQILASRVGKVWVKTMSSKKADPSDSKGRTPLHYAIFDDDKDLSHIRSLVEKGADINKKDHNGFTALNFAMMDNKIDAFNYFIEKGGDINNKNHLGLTILAFAIVEKKTEFIKILLNHGVGVEDCDSNGHSALHIACMKGNVEAAELLLQAGASPDIYNKAGMSPLALAKLNKVNNYDKLKKLIFSYSPLSISYETEFIHRHLIGQAFSVSRSTHFLPKEGQAIHQVRLERSFPIPWLWEEIEESFNGIAKDRPDLLNGVTQKVLEEALKFAKNPHSPSELYKRWKENKPVFIETGYQNHFVAALLYKDHLIIVNRGGGNEGKRVRVEKIRSERITEETIKSIQNLTDGLGQEYVKFMHKEFPRNYTFKHDFFEKRLENLSNEYIDHQTSNNCAFANREGATVVLSQMLGELKESSFISLPLLQKCYFAEKYLDIISNEEHAYYPSPILIAEMALHLRQEIIKISDPQTKKKVEESAKKLEDRLTALQRMPTKSMAPVVKDEWRNELRTAREIFNR